MKFHIVLLFFSNQENETNSFFHTILCLVRGCSLLLWYFICWKINMISASQILFQDPQHISDLKAKLPLCLIQMARQRFMAILVQNVIK